MPKFQRMNLDDEADLREADEKINKCRWRLVLAAFINAMGLAVLKKMGETSLDTPLFTILIVSCFVVWLFGADQFFRTIGVYVARECLAMEIERNRKHERE